MTSKYTYMYIHDIHMCTECIVIRAGNYCVDITRCEIFCVVINVGYFTLRIWEQNKRTPLAEYELAVTRKSEDECQKDFSLTLNVAGGELIN